MRSLPVNDEHNGKLCKPIPGYEQLYVIYPDGKVFALGRLTIGGSRGGPAARYYRPHQMKFLMDDGYARVQLTDWHGVQTKHHVSTLMKLVGFCRRSASRPIDRRKKFRDRSQWRERWPSRSKPLATVT